MIVTTLDYYKSANYSLINNRIPLCKSLEITNRCERPLTDVHVVCMGPLLQTSHSSVLPVVRVGETVRLCDVEILPDIDQLIALTESMLTSFTIQVLEAGEVADEKQYELELMAYDQWLGTQILPQTIVSFVTPNHEAVKALALSAAGVLKEMNGSSQLLEYQSGNTNDVRQQVAAIYGAIHRLGIVYRALPASYGEVGQRVTLPHSLLQSKLGNCIELTVLFASVLETVSINCGLIFEKGHVYLGVWLVDDAYAYSICDDAAYIEKKCSRGIGEMMVLECTMVTNENTAFEQAVAEAEKKLADHERFEMFIDLHRCRLEHFLPLPLSADKDGQWRLTKEAVEHDQCLLDLKEHDRFDLTNIADTDRKLNKMDIWERKLLDFTLRNQLLNLSLRRRAIQIISFDIDKIEDHLADGEEYSILPKPEVEYKVKSDERQLMKSKLLEPLHALIQNDMEHHVLHTYQTEAETRNTLKNIYRAKKVMIEETGANSLFLALGSLRWYESDLSEQPHYAPIVLVPVDMVCKKGAYFIRMRDEETMLNITLIEFLRQNFDIKVRGLNPLPKDEHGVDVPLIFALIRDALKDQKRWDVEEECLLGTFSFSKFLMWNDVHNHREEMLQNPVVSSLVQNRLMWKPESVEQDLREVDSQLSPADLALPVAVDSSQMAAVIGAGMGRSFILYGPPGTGKSQTITNLIANALFQGKRVLFVAEKMAALSVVQNRLAKIGLDAFCLEMHSNKVTKKHILDQFAKALAVTHILAPADYKDRAERIFEHRKQLIQYLNALHDVEAKDGLSLYDCIVRYADYKGEAMAGFASNPTLDATLTRNGISEIEDLLGSKLQTIFRLVGQPASSPLNGLTVDENHTPDQIAAQLEEARMVIEKSVHDLQSLQSIDALKQKLLRDNSPEILAADVQALHSEWKGIKAKWLVPRFFAKRAFVDEMRKYDQTLVAEGMDLLLDQLMDYQALHQRIEQLHKALASSMHLTYGPDVVPDLNVLVEAMEKIGKWIGHKAMMVDWVHWCNYAQDLRRVGLDSVVTALTHQTWASADQLREAFFKALYQYKAEQKIAAQPILAHFEGMIFDEKVKTYIQLTEEYQQLTQHELYARLAAQVPRVAQNLDASSEIGYLNRNISKGGKGTSLRDLLDHIPNLLPRLCPCMLMSPLSVAQFLDLQQEKFDLVVFDEASQMPTSEAVGAIARGKALVVVGDPKQMPPTNFFKSASVDEEEVAIDDMESILEDCRTLEIPSLQLNWHYRSRHESLIAFSNNEYYEGSLITFPSTDDQQSRVRLVPLEGYYDKGGKCTNRGEAEAIVAEVERRLRDPELARQSIGVISFNIKQQALIEDLLQDLLDKDQQLREVAEGMYEPIFVKNLENVQGDERDIILFSIGYGPDKEGKVAMNFGPLNKDGGERRLNVAVSRARCEMMVFSTLRSTQIDLRRTNARGVEGLKHFLEYAESHTLTSSLTVTKRPTDAIVAEQIASALAPQGYKAEVKVGRSMFKVDVAVCHPDQPDKYLLGILLDGQGYRNTQTTRDREVVQPSALRGLNWQVMRVWSVDWFRNPNRVMGRILEALRNEPQSTTETQTYKGGGFDITGQPVEEEVTQARPYVEYRNARRKNYGDDVVISEIVRAEQPIMLMNLARKVCALRDYPRVIPTQLDEITHYVNRNHYVQPDREGTVVWLDETSSQDYPWYRTDSDRDMADIPTIEVRNALHEVLVEQFAIGRESLTLIAAKKLGFTRRGTKVEGAIEDALAQLLAAGQAVVDNDRIKLAD